MGVETAFTDKINAAMIHMAQRLHLSYCQVNPDWQFHIITWYML